MYNIERAKKALETSGYIHPDNTNSNNQNKKYKTLNTEIKDKDYESSYSSNKYSTLENLNTGHIPKNTQNKILPFPTCPLCDNIALYECKCEHKDKQCVNSHSWYINKLGQVITEDPHKNK